MRAAGLAKLWLENLPVKVGKSLLPLEEKNLLQELNKENPNIFSFPLDVTDGPLCKKNL